MQRIPAKHRALGRSVVELEARDPQLLGGVVGSLLNPLLGGGTQPTTTPSNPQPSPSPNPTPVSGSGSTQPNSGSSGGVLPPPPPPPPASPASGGGSGNSPSPSPSPNSPAPAPSKSSGSSTAPSSSPSSGGNLLGTGTSSPAPVNVGAPSATSVGVATATPAVVATGVPVASLPPQGVVGSNSNTMPITPSATLTTSSAVSGSSQLSGGAIAGIVIVCLLALVGIIVLIARRRSIARRVELRKQWWAGHRQSSGSFSFISNPPNPSASSGGAPGSRNSARSSFATNFDQGLMFRVDEPMGTGSMGLLPEFPPMAEVRDRNAALVSTGGEVARRESLNSMLSNGSGSSGQYLSAPTGNKAEPPSPMSVRPFSPSESFSFPKPPPPQAPASAGSADSFFLAGAQATVPAQSSTSTLVHIEAPPRVVIGDDLPQINASFPPASSPTNPPGLGGDKTPSPVLFVANPDPFVDPAKPEFADVEIIRRPFTPTLDDELAVFPGDRVRILQAFDDGWAFVEKFASNEFDRTVKGLIPVDCLREAGQALPTFLAQKRVSSYGMTDMAPTAH